MILAVGVIQKNLDSNIIGYKLMEVENKDNIITVRRTKITSVSGVYNNIGLVANMEIDKNNKLSATDSNINDYPIITPEDKLLTNDKIIVAYMEGDKYVCISGKGNAQVLSEYNLIGLLSKQSSLNAVCFKGSITPKYGVPFRQKDNSIELSKELGVPVESSVEPNSNNDSDGDNGEDSGEGSKEKSRIFSDTEEFRPKVKSLNRHYNMTPSEKDRLNKLAFDSIETLNYQQKEAATTIDGNVRLIAGAGTGKTNTLTKRIAYIIGSGVNPDRILSVTFTNKAAAEMRERAAKLLGIDEKYLRLQTFHSLCNDILRQSIHVIGWKTSFSLGGVGAFKEMLADIMSNDVDLRAKAIASSDLTYIRKKILDKNKEIRKMEDCSYAEYLINKPLPQIDSLKYVINYEMNRDKEMEAGTWDKTQDENSPLLNYVAHIFAYQRRISYLSFDDLIALTLLIFKKYPKVLEYWQNRFDYIQVDEFQDTSPMQFELVKLLSEKKHNLFVVGDPDQSIYAFRNAAPEILIHLDKKLPNIKDIVMDINYRSTDEILKCGNEVIRMCDERLPKDLQIASEKQHGKKPKVLFDEKSSNLVAKIVRSIQGHIKDGVPMNEIAVLYRSKMSESLSNLVEELTLSKIKFKVYGNSSMEKLPEFDFITSLLNSCLNRDNPYHILQALKAVRGIRLTKKTKEAFKNSSDCIETFKELYNNHKFSVESYNSLDKIDEFIEVLENMQKNSGNGSIKDLSCTDLSNMMLTVFTSESEETINNIYSKISEYKTEADLNGEIFDLAFLVSKLALVDDSSEDDKDNCVQIMTIHKAKGLEFKVVFVLNINTNNFPSKQNKGNIDEEVRLAYVAYTRAKEVLYLTCNTSESWYGTSGPSYLVTGLTKENLEMNKTTELKWQSLKLEALRSFRQLKSF